ncbi:MAG TPA: cytochrome P450 [Sporichthya sp.]|nr:cytochrome P450 [Sporichthya sp.]
MRRIDELPYLDYFDAGVAADPEAAVIALAEQDWIARTPFGIAVLRYDECFRLLRDQRLSAPPDFGLKEHGVTGGRAQNAMANVLMVMQGEEHRRVRALVAPALSRSNADRLRPQIRAFVADALSDVADKGVGDLIDAVAVPLPPQVICAWLGLPDTEARRVAEWADTLSLVMDLHVKKHLPRIEECMKEVWSYVEDRIEAVRAVGAGGEDTISQLIRAEEAGDRLTNEEMINLILLSLVAGSDTTRMQLGNALWLFAQRPDQWDLLRAQPDLVASAVEEAMRFKPVTFKSLRYTREPIEFHDVALDEGVFVELVNPAAHHDRNVYGNAAEFDITRFAERGQRPQLTFGAGPHQCVGQFLARAEMEEALLLLSARMPGLRLDPDDAEGVVWKPPFGATQGPTRLPMRWNVEVSA